MVAGHPQQDTGAMVSRMRAPAIDRAPLISPLGSGDSVRLPHPLDFNIEIHAKDGTLLLRLFERNGQLACEGDQSRMEEGAKAFLYQMLQWSGQVKLRWKDDVVAQAEGQ
jgi:hypothetical protein